MKPWNPHNLSGVSHYPWVILHISNYDIKISWDEIMYPYHSLYTSPRLQHCSIGCCILWLLSMLNMTIHERISSEHIIF